MHYMFDIVAVIVMLLIVLFVRYVVEPYIKLQQRRKQSRLHNPEPFELWVQDDGMLYIAAVSQQGVELISFDPITRQPSRWVDSWDAWRERLRTRVVFFSGQKRELKI
jgi:hypothetical protein